MITQQVDLAARRVGCEAQAQFRKFIFKFGVMPFVGLAGVGYLMGLTGANYHSEWPGVCLIALGVLFGGIAALIRLTASPGRPTIQRRHKGGAQVSRVDEPMETTGVLVLSRLRSGLSTHLGSLSFEGQGAFAT